VSPPSRPPYSSVVESFPGTNGVSTVPDRHPHERRRAGLENQWIDEWSQTVLGFILQEVNKRFSMMRFYPATNRVVSVALGLVFVALSFLPARAQLLGQEPHAYSHGGMSGMDPLVQQSYGLTGFGNTVDFLRRKVDEEEERQAERERHRRIIESYGNV